MWVYFNKGIFYANRRIFFTVSQAAKSLFGNGVAHRCKSSLAFYRASINIELVAKLCRSGRIGACGISYETLFGTSGRGL